MENNNNSNDNNYKKHTKTKSMKMQDFFGITNLDLIKSKSEQIKIKGKKEKHYLIYCMDYDNNDKKIDYSKLIIETKDSQPLALLPANGEDQMGGTNDCVINCPMCGSVNILNMSNTEFKCNFCESPLF